MIGFRWLTMCCAGAVMFVVAAGSAAGAYEYRYNLSSHSAAFFEDFMSGRAWIVHRPEDRNNRNKVWGAYFDPAGFVYICSNYKSGYGVVKQAWRTVDSRKFGSLMNIRKPGEEPDPNKSRRHKPFFYDPETGRVHDESWWKPKSIWYVALDGWVQDSWPRVLKDACPDLPLPAAIPINELQTSRRMDELRKQDPDAAIRNYPGSELRRLGGVGIGASRNKPTVTVADLDRFFVQQNGNIVQTPLGRRYVLAIGGPDDELWWLGDDDEEIVDVAYATVSDDGKRLVWSFEKRKTDGWYVIGEAFPALPTGKRHAAHRLSDWMVAQDREFGLPFLDRDNVGIRFEAGGRALVATTGGEEIAGKWWWSRGNLLVQLPGVNEVMSYAWEPLGERLGWPG